MIAVGSCADCHDLYDVLLSPASPNLTNLSITLHISALRHDRETGKVRAWVWLDTEDMLANPLTKLEANGTLPLASLHRALAACKWEPRLQFKYNGVRVDPRH